MASNLPWRCNGVGANTQVDLSSAGGLQQKLQCRVEYTSRASAGGLNDLTSLLGDPIFEREEGSEGHKVILQVEKLRNTHRDSLLSRIVQAVHRSRQQRSVDSVRIPCHYCPVRFILRAAFVGVMPALQRNITVNSILSLPTQNLLAGKVELPPDLAVNRLPTFAQYSAWMRFDHTLTHRASKYLLLCSVRLTALPSPAFCLEIFLDLDRYGLQRSPRQEALST